jgi:ring-1,2-phenylacetyl-CoA epoxidase subunit PaaC
MYFKKTNYNKPKMINDEDNHVIDLNVGGYSYSTTLKTLKSETNFPGMFALKTLWKEKIEAILNQVEEETPPFPSNGLGFGGRSGQHSEHLAPLLKEMTEVYQIDPEAEW